MAGGNVKLFSITTVFFAICAILFFGLSVTSLQKYTAQKKRVHHMEQKILAGKKEVMKVPEMIGKLRKADKESRELKSQMADLTESNEELNSELEEVKTELTTVTIAKAVLETDRAGYTKNLIEARQAVEELKNQLSTNDGGLGMYEEESSTESLSDEVEEMEKDLQPSDEVENRQELQASNNEETTEPEASKEGTTGIQTTLESIRSIILSLQFSYSQVERQLLLNKLSSLVDQAKGQAGESTEIVQLLDDFAQLAASSSTNMDEVLASLDQVQSKF